MSKYKSLLSGGFIQPLDILPFHEKAPFSRYLMAGKDVLPFANLHTAVHEIRDLPKDERSYCKPHRHSCAELNLILSSEHLVFRIMMEEEEHIVNAPASIFVPPGLLHSANVIEGSGFFVTILQCSDYESSLLQRAEPILPSD